MLKKYYLPKSVFFSHYADCDDQKQVCEPDEGVCGTLHAVVHVVVDVAPRVVLEEQDVSAKLQRSLFYG
jgi:hypothetical protein